MGRRKSLQQSLQSCCEAILQSDHGFWVLLTADIKQSFINFSGWWFFELQRAQKKGLCTSRFHIEKIGHPFSQPRYLWVSYFFLPIFFYFSFLFFFLDHCKDPAAAYVKSIMTISSRRKNLLVNIPFTTELSCSICLEPYKVLTQHDAVRLGCQHAFGRKCIQTWASQSTKCPTCRSNFSPESLWADENILRRLSYRGIVALCEDSGVYSGLSLSLILCSCIIAIVICNGDGAIESFVVLVILSLITGYYSFRSVDPYDRQLLATLAISPLLFALALLIINTMRI